MVPVLDESLLLDDVSLEASTPVLVDVDVVVDVVVVVDVDVESELLLVATAAVLLSPVTAGPGSEHASSSPNTPTAPPCVVLADRISAERA